MVEGDSDVEEEEEDNNNSEEEEEEERNGVRPKISSIKGKKTYYKIWGQAAFRESLLKIAFSHLTNNGNTLQKMSLVM